LRAKKKQKRQQTWAEKVASVIRASRQSEKLTRAQLAGRLGWTEVMVINVERMKREATVTDVILIAQALGVDPERMFVRILKW